MAVAMFFGYAALQISQLEAGMYKLFLHNLVSITSSA